jgi:hypothetical protein
VVPNKKNTDSKKHKLPKKITLLVSPVLKTKISMAAPKNNIAKATKAFFCDFNILITVFCIIGVTGHYISFIKYPLFVLFP